MKIGHVFFAALSLTFLVSACGSHDADMRTGRFALGNIEGLGYSTDTQSGTTDAEGQFRYKAGETVRFSVGGIELGSVKADRVISPFDLVGLNPRLDSLELITDLAGYSHPGDDFLTTHRHHYLPGNQFHRVINISNLLLSLDQDQDFSNGIQLGDLQQRMVNEFLDFDQPLLVFNRSFSFKNILNLYAGRSRAPETVFRQLNDALDLDMAIPQPADMDVSATGTASSGYRMQYRYDQRGYLTAIQQDVDRDGTVDSVRSFEFDDMGRMHRKLRDSNADGIDDVIETFMYDARGNLTGHEVDTNADGRIEQRVTFEYDGNDRRIASYTYNEVSGALRASESRDYDGQGRVLLQEEFSYPSGALFRQKSWIYDGSGRLRSVLDDRINSISEIESYVYDGYGRVRQIDYDSDADGNIDRYYSIEYDALNRIQLTRYDSDNDGNVDFETSYAYTPFNAVAEWRTTAFVNGVGQLSSRMLYEYDGNGYPVQIRYDTDGDGNYDSITNYHTRYETKGFLSSLRYLPLDWDSLYQPR